MTTSTRHHTVLRRIRLMSTIWPITCECGPLWSDCGRTVVGLWTRSGENKQTNKTSVCVIFRFFLMYLINKDETEHTGQVRGDRLVQSCSRSPLVLTSGSLSLLQESYVWKMYQERCWDFFPAGDCFRKQYEDQLS